MSDIVVDTFTPQILTEKKGRVFFFFYQCRGRPTHNGVLSALDWRGLWSAGNLMGVSSSSYEQLKVATLIAWHFMRYATKKKKKKQFADNLCSAIIKKKPACQIKEWVISFYLSICSFFHGQAADYTLDMSPGFVVNWHLRSI